MNIPEDDYDVFNKIKYTYDNDDQSWSKRHHDFRKVMVKAVADESNGNKDDNIQMYLQIANYVLIVGMSLSLITSVAGVTTWILIPKWRKFKNYIFMIIILNFTVLYCLFETTQIIRDNYYLMKTIDFFLNSSTWWLVVASAKIYMDLVKVFRSDITRKTLKSNLLVWGIAALITVFIIIDDSQGNSTKELRGYDLELILPLVVSCVLYFMVLRALFKQKMLTQNGWRKTQAATIAFLISGAMMLVSVLAAESPDSNIFNIIALLVFVLQTSAVNLVFFTLKNNRQVWSNYISEPSVSSS